MAARKKTKKKTSGEAKKANPAFDVILAALKRNPNVAYATVRDSAEKKGLTIHPIMYGRAKALLGLVKVSKRGQGKAKKAAAKKRGPGRPRKVGTGRGPGRPPKLRARRGPGRPRKVPSGLDGIVGQIGELQRERDRAVALLDKIRELVVGA